MADEKDPIALFTVDDEAERTKERPEAELNVEAPADKAERERDEAGKFKGKEGEEKPEVKAEAKPDAKVEPKVEEKRNDTVPLATFLEKTNKLKADLEARDITLNEFKTKLAALEAKLPKEQPPAEPDYIEDPKGYVDHKLKTALEGIAEANKKADATGAEAKATADKAAEEVQAQRFFGDLQQHEARFVAQNPDYYDALAHIRGVRIAQIKEFNPEVTDQQIRDAIVSEERQLAITLARQGRDPVQTAYNLARHFGYQKKAPPSTEVAVEVEKPKLPEVPAAKRLPPDQTLGAGAGGANDEPNKDEENDPVNVALASLFRKRA